MGRIKRAGNERPARGTEHGDRRVSARTTPGPDPQTVSQSCREAGYQFGGQTAGQTTGSETTGSETAGSETADPPSAPTFNPRAVASAFAAGFALSGCVTRARASAAHAIHAGFAARRRAGGRRRL